MAVPEGHPEGVSPLNQGHKEPAVRIGLTPETRRQMWQKLMWVGIWLAFMGAPIGDLLDGDHTTAATVLGWLGLATFVTVYLALVLRHTARPRPARRSTASWASWRRSRSSSPSRSARPGSSSSCTCPSPAGPPFR